MIAKSILIFQVLYYLLTALWPMIHMRSFEAVAGPKKEHWLVYTVSLLLLGIISPMIYHLVNSEKVSVEIMILSIAAAMGLALIDIIFSLRGIIWKTYLIDAAIEILMILGLILHH
jgi:hypothetical protein